MPSIKGYKFDNQNDAIYAVSSCNNYYNIPVNSQDTTKNWVNYRCANLNNPIFWYIIYDETLTPVLGNPIEFEVIFPIFP